MRSFKMAALATVASGALMLSACAADVGGEPSSSTLTVGRLYDVILMDPAAQYTAADYELVWLMYDGLVRFEPGSTEITPSLASEWTTSDDGTIWTFTLEDGVEFHGDHGVLTSEDVVYTFERILDPEFGSPAAVQFGSIEEITAIDGQTVKFALTAPDPDFLGKLAGTPAAIVSKAAVTELGESFAQNPVGTGPFNFVDWVPETELTLESFDAYWRGAPALDEISFVPVGDSTTLYRGFESGDFDMVQVTSLEKFEKYSEEDTMKVDGVPLLQTRFMQMSDVKGPTSDPAVREAINYAIDRAALVNALFGEMSQPADSWLPPGLSYRIDGLIDYEFDPNKAKEILAAAGYEDGVSATLSVPNNARFTEPAVIIQSDLAKVGIDVEVETLEYAAFGEGQVTGDGFEMWIMSRGAESVNPDAMTSQMWAEAAIPTTNWSRIVIPGLDSLLSTATTTIDEDTRTDAFEEIQHLVADANAAYYIDHEKYIWAMSEDVSGVVLSPWRTLHLDGTSIE